MICAIVPAAGCSRRMGTQKLLLPYAGSTVIERIVDELLASSLGRVVVVVRADGAGITTRLVGRDIQTVVNPDADGDMLSSVRCGLRALPDDCQTVIVALGDQPTIRSAWIAELIAAHRKFRRGIVVPVHAGKRGHPLLFSMRYREELLQSHDGTGLRGLLVAHADDVLELGLSTPAVLDDMDELEDYQRLTGDSPAAGPA